MGKNLVRSNTAQQDVLKQWKGARLVHWEVPPNRGSVMEVQNVPDPSVFKNVPLDKNYLIPPYHWHWHQAEHFEIHSGRYIVKIDGKMSTLDKSAGKIVIPKHRYHTFWADPDSGEPCKINISTEQTSNGLDEIFFRNLYSYQEDCADQGIEPSIVQMLLFLDYSETSMALPGPPFIMRWVSYLIGLLIGRWFGGYVLGMKANYPEYFDHKSMKRA